MKRFVLGVDSSTTACKVIAWDRSGNALGEGRAPIPLLSSSTGCYEQKAEHWWTSLLAALNDLGNSVDLKRAESICIAHQRETFVLVDDQCRPLRNAITWMDERGASQLSLIERVVGGEHFRSLTGKPLSLTLSFPKLIWLHQHEPETLGKAYKVLDVQGFLTYKLTGAYRTSLGSADPLGLINVHTGTWSYELANVAGLRQDQLTEVVPTGEEIGKVSKEASLATGLPEGLPVIAGIGDGQAAGIGAGVLDESAAYLNLGTCVVSGLFCEGYVVGPAFRTLSGPSRGTYYLEHTLRSGAFLISWFVDRFAPELKEVTLPLSPEEILELSASKLSPGSNGLVVVPYWSGVMDPYWDPVATGVVLGWHGSHGREHFYRAILEGIAFEQRLAQEETSRVFGRFPVKYLVMGGGSKSNLWCQIISDVTGVPVVRVETPEVTSLGAGVIAAVASGWYRDLRSGAAAMSKLGKAFEPDQEHAAIYAKLYREVYTHLFLTLRERLDKLSSFRS